MFVNPSLSFCVIGFCYCVFRVCLDFCVVFVERCVIYFYVLVFKFSFFTACVNFVFVRYVCCDFLSVYIVVQYNYCGVSLFS